MQNITKSQFYKVLTREINRIANSWVLIFINLIAPLGAFLIIYWLFSQGVVRDLPVTIVDNDHSALSRKIARMIDASPAAKVVSNTFSLDEANDAMEKGLVDAVVFFDNGFEKEVFKGRQQQVVVYINNTNVIKGGILQSGIYKTLATFSAGIKLQMYLKSGLRGESAMDRLQPVFTSAHLLFNPFGNYAYFLVTGLLPIMAIVFIFLGSLYAVGSELRFGSAGELMQAANGNIFAALFGKMGPYTLIYMLKMYLINVILVFVLGIQIKGSLFIVLLSELILVITYQLLAVLFLSLTGNLRFSLSLGSAYTMMALTFSGLTFPSMGMPLVAKIFSWIFPYTFWLKIFLSQTLRGEPVVETIVPFLVLVLFGLISLVSFRGIRRRFSDSKYYGRI